MRKYIFIFKTSFMESLQYVLNIVLGFISFYILLFIFMNLWNYIYSDRSNLINGYSLEQMIWYVILTETIWFGARNRTLTNQISNDIKSGTIAYGINKPYHYIAYVIARYLGEVIIKIFMYLFIGIIIGLSFVGKLPGFDIRYLPAIAFSFILSVLIHALICMNISILSFWIEDTAPFHWIYDKIIIVIGILFPIEMFPLWLQPAIKCSPAYVVTYGPVKLAIDFHAAAFTNIISMQLIYIVICLTVLIALYEKGVRRLNVNGG